MWRKRRQLCGWGSNGPHSQSGDSAGSCYAPPQYSRCSSFHHAPPPYTEVRSKKIRLAYNQFQYFSFRNFQVTSKPDLYPLVFTCNADNGKNGSSYLMVQYFRNYIVRPTTGSLSATSTVDSLSSSFICNANEGNTLVPPPYSRAASPDLPLTIHDYSALPRSASQQGCSLDAVQQQQQQRHHLYRLIPMSCSNGHDANTPNNISDGDGSLSGAGTGSSGGCGSSGDCSASSSTGSQLRTSDSANFQRFQNNNYNNNGSHNTNNSNKNNLTRNNCSNKRNNETDTTMLNMNMPHSDHTFKNILNNVSENNVSVSNNDNGDVIMNNLQLNNNNNNSINVNNNSNTNSNKSYSSHYGGPSVNTRTKSLAIDNYYNPSGGSKTKPNTHYQYGSTSSGAIYNSCGSIEGVDTTAPAVSSEQNLDYKELDVLRRSLETCCQILDKQQQHQQLASGNFSEESPINLDILKKYGSMRSYINSITGSAVSSLANIGSPGSPPQATSPTAEVRELLEQIRQLQKDEHSLHTNKPGTSDDADRQSILHESIDTYDENSIEHTNKNVSQMQPRKRPSSLHHQLNRKSTHRMGGFFPIAAAKNIRSPIGSNSTFLTFGRGRKGWVSRSAPTTPGTTVPSCFLDDDSPLLNEQDEDAEHNT